MGCLRGVIIGGVMLMMYDRLSEISQGAQFKVMNTSIGNV